MGDREDIWIFEYINELDASSDNVVLDILKERYNDLFESIQASGKELEDYRRAIAILEAHL